MLEPKTMTLDELRRILTACAGSEAGIEGPDGELLDTTFESLGYDSLALMETGARIKQSFGVDLPDDEITEAATPRALIELVNRRIPAAS